MLKNDIATALLSTRFAAMAWLMPQACSLFRNISDEWDSSDGPEPY